MRRERRFNGYNRIPPLQALRSNGGPVTGIPLLIFIKQQKTVSTKMGLFSFTQDVAIDLGTANTIITYNGKIVVDEPSVVAIDNSTKKMIAVGERAKQMHEKTNPKIQTIRPLRDGVIADFNACEQMMRGL